MHAFWTSDTYDSTPCVYNTPFFFRIFQAKGGRGVQKLLNRSSCHTERGASRGHHPELQTQEGKVPPGGGGPGFMEEEAEMAEGLPWMLKISITRHQVEKGTLRRSSSVNTHRKYLST